MIEVKRADELGDSIRKDMSRIFTEGFYQWLKFFTKDKKKLSRAFTHMFQLDVFYVALVNNKVAGIASCTDNSNQSVSISRKEFIRHLGLVRGMIAAAILKGEFENHPYPFEMGDHTGSIEFVASSPKCRGKGVASAIISHIKNTQKYEDYVLEVADTNTAAVNLYEKSGFKEFTRVPQKHPKQSGVNYLIYMKCKE